MQIPIGRTALVAIAPLAAAVAVAGCGGSSKPGYCSDRSKLEQSVKDVDSSKVLQKGGIKNLQGQLQAIETNAGALVSSAKGDFPAETNAIQTSVANMKASVQQLPDSPTPQQLAAVAKNAKGVVTSVQGFVKASGSKCE
jgi:hypothetical protein